MSRMSVAKQDDLISRFGKFQDDGTVSICAVLKTIPLLREAGISNPRALETYRIHVRQVMDRGLKYVVDSSPPKRPTIVNLDSLTQAIGLLRVVDEQSLTHNQSRTILHIARSKAIGCTALAKRLGVSPAGVTGIVNQLEMRSLVFRTHERGDRREVLVDLTPQGLELVKMICKPIAC